MQGHRQSFECYLDRFSLRDGPVLRGPHKSPKSYLVEVEVRRVATNPRQITYHGMFLYGARQEPKLRNLIHLFALMPQAK